MSNTAKSSPDTAATFGRICSPGNLRGNRISARKATLTWDEPYSRCDLCPNAVAFEVSGSGIETVLVTHPPYELELSPHGNRRISVRALAAGAKNVSGPSEIVLYESPATPINLRVTDASEDGVTLHWNPAGFGVEPFDYWITYRGQFIAHVHGLSYRLSYSTRSASYDFEVRARSIHGNFSDPALLDITPPDKPVRLIAANLSSRAALLMWQRSDDNVGVVAYEVLKNGVVIELVEGISAAHLAIGLTPETEYEFSIRALDAAGNRSEASDPIRVKTPFLDPPKNVRVVNVTRFSIELVWGRPDGGIGWLGYESEADNHKNSQRKIQSPLQGVAFIGLQPASTYTVSIRCHDASQRYSEPYILEVKTN